jgi:adenylate cyclase
MTREQARRLWHLLPLAVRALVGVGPDLIDTFVPGTALVNRVVAAQITTPGVADWLPRLKKLVEHKTAVSGDSNPQQNALFEQYTRVLQALARRRPLLLALDDLQWADAGSTSLLFHLGRRIEGHRILIVGAYRPTEVALGRGGPSTSPWSSVPGTEGSGQRERHPLEPVVNEFKRHFGDIEVDLGRSGGRQFIDAFLDTEPNRLGDAFRGTLYQQTRGHPLFTIELLRGMEERGDLVQDGEGRWVEGPSLDWETLPTRVEAVIAERIGRLPERLREALTVASVEGETFTAEVVAQVRTADEREVVGQLSGELGKRYRLVSGQGLLQMGGQRLSQYRFRHILFQKYLYNSLDPVERAHLHQAVGAALEALYGEGAEEIAVIAVQLARHFQEAGIADKAVAYLLQAGNRAMRLSANEEAIAHFTQGLRLLKTLPDSPERIQQELDLLVALGVPLVLTQGHAAPEVETTYARARELSKWVGDTSQRFQVLMGLRRFTLWRGELQTAHEMGEQLIALAQSVPDHLSRAHTMHGEALYCLGEFVQAQEHYRQGITLYAPQQHRSHIFLYGNDTEVICRVFWALVLWHLGYPDQALDMSTEGLSRAQELSHPFTLVCALYFTATLHQFRQEIQAVRERVEALLRISTERGFTLYLAWGAVLRGWALVEQGQEDEGIEQIRKGIAAQQTATMLPNALACLARAYGKVEKVEEGLSTLTEALRLVDRSGERCWEAELYRLKGELLQQGGAEAEAEACFRRAIEVARRQSAKSWELRATGSLGRLWQKQGQREEARELLQEVYDWFTEGFDTPDLKEAQALLDALA